MDYQKIDGQLFAQMVLAGAKNLQKHVKDVDGLNVFPVPDGDTGTNMNLSLTSGVNELKKNNSNHLGEVANALAKGLLMGARGNSGVILSQLFRGFSKYVQSFAEIDSKKFAEALKQGVDTAYKAVMKPVEGTILTVSREAAEEAIKVARKQANITIVMEEILRKGYESLKKTPDLLPVLKEVGVVDAGGQGLLYVYEGFLSVLKGEEIQVQESEPVATDNQNLADFAHEQHPVQAKLSTDEIEFGYCTEFIIGLNEEIKANQSFSEAAFREKISQFGDSLLVVADDEIVKVHIHSEEPGSVLNFAMQYGSLHKIKIDNMREQHSHILMDNDLADDVDNQQPIEQSPQPFGLIAVAMGDGIVDIFKSLGVDVVISGGQTMNPSTEDILNAINEINADNYIILPNNSNIILAAEQAQSLVDKPIAVIPSKSIPQGIAAMLAFNPTLALAENKQLMSEALKNVKTGQVTFAVRDSKFDELEIKEGNFIGLAEGKIISTAEDLLETAYQLLLNMLDEDDEILTIIYGEDIEYDQVKQLEEKILVQYPDLEIEIHNGGQPLYSFIFSIEG